MSIRLSLQDSFFFGLAGVVGDDWPLRNPRAFFGTHACRRAHACAATASLLRGGSQRRRDFYGDTHGWYLGAFASGIPTSSRLSVVGKARDTAQTFPGNTHSSSVASWEIPPPTSLSVGLIFFSAGLRIKRQRLLKESE